MFTGGMGLNILKLILMGLVQGITEFLPVSSSGHLALFKKIFGVNLDSGTYYDVMLHLATLIAIIVVFHEDVWHMIQEFGQIIMTIFANIIIFFKRKKGDKRYKYFKVINTNYKKIVVMILVSTIPTALIGYFGGDFVDTASNMLWFVGLGFIASAVLLFLADKNSNNRMKIQNAKYSDGYFIGAAQGIATLPGVSRSGSTIAVSMMLGFNKQLAVKYSFLMSIPAILGAVVLKLTHLEGEAFGSANLPGYILGMIVAGVSGYFCIKYMLKLIRNKRYFGFSVYCMIMGLISIIVSIVK